MSKTKAGSNSQFTSAGKGLTVIGEHCYAFSGMTDVDNTETDLLLFQSPKQYIEGKLNITNSGNLSFDEDFYFKVYFNGIIVYAVLLEQAKVLNTSPYIPLLIPPLTEVKITADNVSDTDTRSMSCQIIGKVYG